MDVQELKDSLGTRWSQGTKGTPRPKSLQGLNGLLVPKGLKHPNSLGTSWLAGI